MIGAPNADVPPPLLDGILLELFRYTKTLEELDGIDIGRLNRALQALGYRNAYDRLEARKNPDTKSIPEEERDKMMVRELWLAYKSLSSHSSEE